MNLPSTTQSINFKNERNALFSSHFSINCSHVYPVQHHILILFFFADFAIKKNFSHCSIGSPPLKVIPSSNFDSYNNSSIISLIKKVFPPE
jgi:hypothetical protein